MGQQISIKFNAFIRDGYGNFNFGYIIVVLNLIQIRNVFETERRREQHNFTVKPKNNYAS